MTILLITLLVITVFNMVALTCATLYRKNDFTYMMLNIYGWKKYLFLFILIGAFIIPPFSVFIFCWLVVELVANP